MSAIELRDVEVTFHERGRAVPAVRGVSLNVEPGEVFGIVGYSGAGKSTVVRTINLLERPTAGRVLIDGVDITDAHGADLREVRRTIGVVFQGFNLVGNITVGANIRFALKAGGWDSKDWDRRTRELLKLVGLEDRLNSYPSGLSGGQQQRVAIARALANNPKILLCDEATSALDVETTEGILNLLAAINRRLHITIVFITHQLDIAKRIFDHVAVMEDGRIVEQGTTFDVFSAPKHPTTRSLMTTYLGVSIPEQLKPSLPSGTLVELKYRGDEAFRPLITDVARQHDVSISVLHTNIEYFGSKPIGVLIVLVDGPESNLRAALHELDTHVLEYRVLPREGRAQTLNAQTLNAETLNAQTPAAGTLSDAPTQNHDAERKDEV